MKSYKFVLMFVLIACLLAACTTPAPDPVSTPTPKSYVCTVVVSINDTSSAWSVIYGRFGFDYYHDTLPSVLVNGKVRSHDSVTLRAGYVVSMIDGKNCKGDYNQAQWQEFDDSSVKTLKGDTLTMDGFTKKVTAQATEQNGAFVKGVQENLHDLCASVAYKYGGYHISAISNGCNFTTVVKYSLPSGAVSCQTYDSVPQANDALASDANLPQIKSLALAVMSDANASQAKILLCH